MEILGHVDIIGLRSVKGWAALAQDTNVEVVVELFVEDRLVARTVANIDRPDLAKLPFESTRHGFSFDLTQTGICSLQLPSVRVQVYGAREPLKGVVYQPTQTELGYRNAPYAGKFGGTWLDRLDAPEELARRKRRGQISAAEHELLTHWLQKGYVILKNAVSHELIDQVNKDVDAVWEGSLPGLTVETFEPDGVRKYVPAQMQYRAGITKLLDLYAYSQAAEQAIFSPPIRRFLELLFEAQAWAFQSLSFWHGSEQQIHKDTAYVKVHPPLLLAASWIALEDVEPGNGELQYYEGSHRSPDFLFGGANKWADGHRDEHDGFLASLHSDAALYDQNLAAFRAKKGDVLIWHADLAHGGTPVTNSGSTRKSLVTHYCSEHATPFYFREGTTRREAVEGGYMSTQYENRIATPA